MVAFALKVTDLFSTYWQGGFMTAKQFYDWQTSGGTDDVMRLVDCLDASGIA
jgi:hypothetical protein